MTAGRHTLRLSGYAPALPTPFHETGKLDGTALEWLCHRQIEDGASALVVCGTSAEAPITLTNPGDCRRKLQFNPSGNRVGQGCRSSRRRCNSLRRALLQQADAGRQYATFRAIVEATGL